MINPYDTTAVVNLQPGRWVDGNGEPAAIAAKLTAETARDLVESISMTDALPDRLSVNPKSSYYDEALLGRGVGIRFNGQEKTNVEEYCVSEGWIRVAAGRSLDRFGNPMTVKLKGTVEPYLRDRDGTKE